MDQIYKDSKRDTKDMAKILTIFFGLILIGWYLIGWSILPVVALWLLFMGLNFSLHLFAKGRVK